MKMKPQNYLQRCCHKYKAEHRAYQLTINERGAIENHLNEDELKCLLECNGINEHCSDYTPLEHLRGFQLMRLR